MREDEQIVIQDTLKHLAEHEYDQLSVSEEAIATDLSVSQSELDRILRDLRAAALIAGDTLQLTATGREYALHVLRAHRLYETYLARKTSVGEADWHARAHIKEHQLSQRDLDALARELDNPRFDPHGDPIPTAAGHMPPKTGRALVEQPAGWEGQVIHLEDDPPRLYARIAAASIAPGTVLRIETKDEHAMRVRAEGETFEFPADVARQITVVPLAAGESFDESVRRLSSLTPDEKARIVRLSPLCRGLERNRLLDLGVVPGTVVSVDLINPAGSPVAYRIRGASIALRREQAERILIRKEPAT